jgi:hypothetical protein
MAPRKTSPRISEATQGKTLRTPPVRGQDGTVWNGAMDADLVIGLLKVASAIIGGALGVAAIFANYRDPSGRLTRAGMAVFAGIVASAIVGTVTSIIETNKARRSALEQAERTEVLLRQVSRSILPIREVKLTYWIDVPRGTGTVDEYLERLSEGVEKILLQKFPRGEAVVREREPIKGLRSWLEDENGEISRVGIEKDSDLWPNHLGKDDEAFLAVAAEIFPLSIFIFREPIRPEHYLPLSEKSDFEAHSDSPEDFSYEWDRTRKRLLISWEE